MQALKDCVMMQFKILTLTAKKDDFLALKTEPHLIWGLIMVWLAGIGRAWDNPHADPFTHVGIPSLLYIFVLGFFLFVFIGVLSPRNWSYMRVVTFISMTGIIGLLYAIPVEMMMPARQAEDVNTILLLIVATWRVVMLGAFLIRTTEMGVAANLIALTLPLMLIINVLVWSDKFEKTFGVMGGIRQYMIKVDPNAPTPKEEPGMFGGVYPVQDKTGRAKGQVYENYGSKIPPGFKEIQWDDAEYMPPTLLLAILRPLGLFCQINAPILGIAFIVIASSRFGARRKSKPEPEPEPVKNEGEDGLD